ncbi:MAG: hypothetical protein WC714_04810 [Candidatus Obscuribacterales bacterium]|jgi:hypothetical protein
MQEEKTHRPVLTTFKKAQAIFEQLRNNASLPLSISVSEDWSGDFRDLAARAALTALDELGAELDNLAAGLGTEPLDQDDCLDDICIDCRIKEEEERIASLPHSEHTAMSLRIGPQAISSRDYLFQ